MALRAGYALHGSLVLCSPFKGRGEPPSLPPNRGDRFPPYEGGRGGIGSPLTKGGEGGSLLDNKGQTTNNNKQQ